jgi:hypothetical protein
VDQEHLLQSSVSSPEIPQDRDVVRRVVGPQDGQLHPHSVDHQEQQQVDRAVSGVLELLLLNVPGMALRIGSRSRT